jgi:hypothetical protein
MQPSCVHAVFEQKRGSHELALMEVPEGLRCVKGWPGSRD